MNKKTRIIIWLGMWISVSFIIVFNNLKENNQMNTLLSNVIGIGAGGVVTYIVTSLVNRKSQINKNTETITNFNSNLTTNINNLEKI